MKECMERASDWYIKDLASWPWWLMPATEALGRQDKPGLQGHPRPPNKLEVSLAEVKTPILKKKNRCVCVYVGNLNIYNVYYKYICRITVQTESQAVAEIFLRRCNGAGEMAQPRKVRLTTKRQNQMESKRRWHSRGDLKVSRQMITRKFSRE